jgi:hypothetical protein
MAFAEARNDFQKYTRVSGKTILQHTYDSEVQYMEPVPAPTSEGVRSILKHLGLSVCRPRLLSLDFSNNRFMKQLIDDGLFKQIYPGGVPTKE